jgi:3-methylcrotonyl-CoA carboxylase alpha subunit
MATKIQIESASETWIGQISGNDVRLEPGDASVSVTKSDGRMTAATPGSQHTGNAVVSGDDVWVTIDGEVFLFTVGAVGRRSRSHSRDQDAFTPPMSATIVRIAVKPGDRVEDGDVLIALEAMKMELPIRAPRTGVVKAIHCKEGELVQPGQVLLDFE